ncbi:hypothetical protein SLOPH_760, partial [Spraguea lophii 42_110]
MKRSTRNKKLEDNIEYTIIKSSSIPNIDGVLMDYTQNISTGMEADEEKEVHIKTILNWNKPSKEEFSYGTKISKGNYNNGEDKQESKIVAIPTFKNISNIPLPQIVQVEPSRKSKIYERSNDYIKYEKDVANRYIITKEDIIFLRKTLPESIEIEGKKSDEVNNDKIEEDVNKNEKEIINKDNTDTIKDKPLDINKDNITQESLSEGKKDDYPKNYIITYKEEEYEELVNKIIKNTDKRNEIHKLIYNDDMIEKSGEESTSRIEEQKKVIDSLISYFTPKAILLHSSNDKDIYLCFRKRIIRTSRKQRRNEQICVDKLNRYNKEISILNKILNLTQEKNIISKELEELNKDIFGNLDKIKTEFIIKQKEEYKKINNYDEQKKIEKKKLKNNIKNYKRMVKDAYKTRTYKQPFYKTFYTDIESNNNIYKEKLQELRDIMVNSKLNINEQQLSEDA